MHFIPFLKNIIMDVCHNSSVSILLLKEFKLINFYLKFGILGMKISRFFGHSCTKFSHDFRLLQIFLYYLRN